MKNEKEIIQESIKLTEDEWELLRDKIDDHLNRWNDGDADNVFEITITQIGDKIKYRVSVDSTMHDVEEGEI